MESIEVLRRAVSEIAAKKLGRDARQPRQFSLQLKAAEAMSVLLALPVANEDFAALQSATTGELYLVLGGDPLGGSPLGG